MESTGVVDIAKEDRKILKTKKIDDILEHSQTKKRKINNNVNIHEISLN